MDYDEDPEPPNRQRDEWIEAYEKMRERAERAEKLVTDVQDKCDAAHEQLKARDVRVIVLETLLRARDAEIVTLQEACREKDEAFLFMAGQIGDWFFNKHAPSQEEVNAVAARINTAFASAVHLKKNA